ncbi:BrnA antitoxin family protein [uncultured Thiodictyon sp.]|uniref:BrnA antitoxin family protein n=1 Tax=uncultured Thiodictyon sp. TaxID=1846217 RepID=UPI0025D1D533|nr:BrnA antitoxin family protein [uncultured Thiodictyon sp.]
MRDEYDFSGGKRGAVIQSPGKTRITLMLDDDIVEHFRTQAEAAGTGYHELINDILREAAVRTDVRSREDTPLTVAILRKVLREELHSS